MVALATAMLVSSSASAAMREYRVHFDPSPSTSAVGYILDIGPESGNYSSANFDLGPPPPSGGTIIYAVDLEDSTDLFVAVRAYDSDGETSVPSNEIRVAAVDPPPPPAPPVEPPPVEPPPAPPVEPPPAAPPPAPPVEPPPVEPPPAPPVEPPPVAPPPAPPVEPPPATPPGGGGNAGNAPPPMPMAPQVSVGFVSRRDGMISQVMTDGSLGGLTMDSLAAKRDVRPAACDLDGDGDRDFVLGFGNKSGGRISIVMMEQGNVMSVQSLTTGTERSQQKRSFTNPACGDLDGDGRGEIVVGFSRRMRGVVQILDDVTTGFAPLASARSDSQGFMQVPVPQNFNGPTYPAIGDLDGDGMDELVVGLGRTRWALLVVLDDAAAGFAVHPANRTGEPWLWIDNGVRGKKRKYWTKPALGDIDGDGRDEIAIGFGRKSFGRVAILDDALDGFPENGSDVLILATGRPDYASRNGETTLAFGNLDSDAAEELVVAFTKGAANEVQVFDDLSGTLRPMQTSDGFVQAGERGTIVVPAPSQ